MEICYYNQWGTVCDDLWDSSDAGVVCSQLGYSSTGKLSYSIICNSSHSLLLPGAIAYSSAQFGAGAGPIVMDNVECTGGENRLIECPFIFNHNCGHSEDAGVRCTSSTTGTRSIIP